MTKSEIILPIQPIVDNRFVANKIVEHLLDNGNDDMNSLAVMQFSNQDRMQFAQLIGYSVCGFGDLPYANKETIETAIELAENKEKSELEVRNLELRLIIGNLEHTIEQVRELLDD